MLFGENGIIKKAQEAKEATERDQQETEQGFSSLAEQINQKVNGTGTNSEAVNNPYDPDGWDLAWICTDGVWSDTPLAKGENANGDIIAKFYLTGNKITPPAINLGEELITFVEDNEYKLVIEGKGEMGPLMAESETLGIVGYGWQVQTVQVFMGVSATCIMPYVSEITVCDGVTNIGSFAFMGDTGLKTCILGKDVVTSGDGSFMFVGNPNVVSNTVIYISNAEIAEDLANSLDLNSNTATVVLGKPGYEKKIYEGSVEIAKSAGADVDINTSEKMDYFGRVYKIKFSIDEEKYELVTRIMPTLVLEAGVIMSLSNDTNIRLTFWDGTINRKRWRVPKGL